ncbi:MAG TPA: hypothetical protein VKJ01_13475, partial [Candidatus Solibacter sp.]|nr:hypothetical protein [Candidatus Solibacter sp.]
IPLFSSRISFVLIFFLTISFQRSTIIVDARVFVSVAVELPAPGTNIDWRTGEYWSLRNTSCWWDTSVLEQVT